MRHPDFIVRRRTLALVTCALLAIAAPPVDAHPAQPAPGAADIGDPLFPGLGNGGFYGRPHTPDLVYGFPPPGPAGPRGGWVDAESTPGPAPFGPRPSRGPLR